MEIRTKALGAEFSWFNDMCDGDTDQLGQRQPERRSSFRHCLDVMQVAEQNGFKGILLPTAYDTGLDSLTFAAAAAPLTNKIKPIVALRMGEIYPTTLSRSLVSLDEASQGRFVINAISSDFPGQKLPAHIRYDRTGELLDILIQGWEKNEIHLDGQYYSVHLDAAPAKCRYNKRPLIYFGGISPEAKAIAAKYADVYLMWPEKKEMMRETMLEVSEMAAREGRTIDFGLRIHMIVRETEAEAKQYAKRLVSKLDSELAYEIRSKHQDAVSYGVFRQDELRKNADLEGYIEPLVWSSVGKVFSGCGSALVGSGSQIKDKLQDYMQMGFRAFIHSGFPLIEEANYFGQLVLPYMNNINLSYPSADIPQLSV